MSVDRAALQSLGDSAGALEWREFAERQRRPVQPSIGQAVPARRMGPWSWLAGVARNEMRVYADHRRAGRLPVTAITHRATQLIYQAVELAEQFAWAHAGGFVTRRVRDLRSAHCVPCMHRVLVRGARYCDAKACHCPQRSWWPFSKMGWWLWLHNVACPLGRWKHSDVGPLSAVPLTIRGRAFEPSTSRPRTRFEVENGVANATPTSSLS